MGLISSNKDSNKGCSNNGSSNKGNPRIKISCLRNANAAFKKLDHT
jgi:hypothetical protein